MEQASDIVKKMREFVGRPEWSKTRLAREMKLSPNALRDLDLPSFNPTLHTLQKFEEVASTQPLAE